MPDTDRPLALILRTAGTNCDGEMCRAFELAGARAERIHIDRLIADPSRLRDADLIGFPGGFSYGDDIASGRVLAVKVRERLLGELLAAVERGVPIIGVCNGFQALVQIGLLPGRGIEGSRQRGSKGGEGAGAQASMPGSLDASMPLKQSVALADNVTARFIDHWLPVEFPESRCVWTQELWSDEAHAADVLRLPIAHGEGRFVAADETVLRAIENGGQVALRYGENVNGSENAIAGICDATGLVFGLMPHPERYAEWTQHPYWTRLDRGLFNTPTPGLKMFLNAVEHVKAGAPVNA